MTMKAEEAAQRLGYASKNTIHQILKRKQVAEKYVVIDGENHLSAESLRVLNLLQPPIELAVHAVNEVHTEPQMEKCGLTTEQVIPSTESRRDAPMRPEVWGGAAAQPLAQAEAVRMLSRRVTELQNEYQALSAYLSEIDPLIGEMVNTIAELQEESRFLRAAAKTRPPGLLDWLSNLIANWNAAWNAPTYVVGDSYQSLRARPAKLQGARR